MALRIPLFRAVIVCAFSDDVGILFIFFIRLSFLRNILLFNTCDTVLYYRTYPPAYFYILWYNGFIVNSAGRLAAAD
ncbi:hypothetical protein AO411_2029450 [Salmonella enterica subsp. enterica serovar Sarajane]|nr:hypothetical protein AO411_2029450 [Salmonella enterica subsp. enterica serovar Sarajane]